MPNYRYVATSKFEPFTFDEMLKPALLAQAKHDEIEKAYGELGENAEELRSIINEINDPTSYARYKQYENAFDENYQSFSKHGLNHKSNKALMDVKRYYKNRVKPIENAFTTRKEQQDYIRKLVDANPTLLIQNDILSPGNGSSLDRWLEDSNYSYGKTYSGAMITKQVAEALAPIAKSLTSYGKSTQIDDYTNTFVKQFGYTPQKAYEAMQAYLANPNAPNDFVSKVINSVIDSSGIRSWANEEALSRAYNYGAQAIPAIIGTGDVSPIDNFEKRQEVINGYKNPPPTSKEHISITPSVLTANREDMNKKLNRWKNYFDVKADGSYVLNEKGRNLLKTEGHTRTGAGGTLVYEKHELRKEFEDFIVNDLGFDQWDPKYGDSESHRQIKDQPDNIGNKFTSYYKRHAGEEFDTYRSAYYPTTIVDKNTSDAWLSRLEHEYKHTNGIPTVEFLQEKGKSPAFVVTGKFKPGKDAKVIAINLSSYGNFMTIKDDSGEHDVLIPDNINQANVPAARTAMQYADEYNKILAKGYIPEVDEKASRYGIKPAKRDKNGQIIYTKTPLSETDRLNYDIRHTQAIQDASEAIMGAIPIYGVKEDKISPQSFSNQELLLQLGNLLDNNFGQ